MPMNRNPSCSKTKRSSFHSRAKSVAPDSDHLVSWLPGMTWEGIFSPSRRSLASRSCSREPYSVTSPDRTTKLRPVSELISRTAARKSCSPDPEPTWVSLSQAKRKEAGAAKRRSGSNHTRKLRKAARRGARNVRVGERRCDMRLVSPDASIISSRDQRAGPKGRAALKSGRSPEIRSPKPEGRKKAETRNPRMAGSDGLSLRGDGCGFGNSDFSLLSAFGLRVSALDRTESSLEHPCHLTRARPSSVPTIHQL